MASSEEKIDSTTAPTDDGFTYADEVFVDGEMLGTDQGTSRVDPADYTTSKQLKDEDEDGKGGKGEDPHHKLKSTLIISGVAVAVIGAILAIAKKIKEA